MNKASRIVFLVVTILIISCGVVLGQKCDCQDECKEGVPHCIGGVCKCLPPKTYSTDHEDVVLEEACLRDCDCPRCTEGLPLCGRNGSCTCLTPKTYSTDYKGVVLGEACIRDGDCPNSCPDQGIPVCANTGFCICIPPRPCSTNHEDVKTGETCKSNADCEKCLVGFPFCVGGTCQCI